MLTKQTLLSDIARLYNVLGWCSPAIVKPKVLLQHMWREKSDWDDPVPQCILAVWQPWHSELHVLWKREIPRRYFLKDLDSAPIELHGFCDASELVYTGVVYIRTMNVNRSINHTALAIAKMKVAPIKCLSSPWLELCDMPLVTKLLLHCGQILVVPLEST